MLLSTLVTAALAVAAPATKFVKRFDSWDYEHDKLQGVNLGGWFVLEPYINPLLFKACPGAVDEYTLTQALGKKNAQIELENHWDTWYTKQDFQDIKDAGLNMVRIPIGYWAYKLLDDDPYVQGQIKYLDRALQWCRELDLKVWIDLHGAPGSQNGFDNSGKRDLYDFQKGLNVDTTLWVLQQIFWKYGHGTYYDTVIGIELLNEPLGPILNLDNLKTFYTAGYKNLRLTGLATPVVFHDAFFQDKGFWDLFMTVDQGYWSVVLDHHHYQVFSPQELGRNQQEHLDVACQWGANDSAGSHWAVCGEWLAALTDCAPWLNGVGRGARWLGDYDNSPKYGLCDQYLNLDTWSDDYKKRVRQYIEAQLDAFEQGKGWIFWNWKTENAPEWDMKQLVDAGIFPQPLSDRQYPGQCSKH